jgi:hypothetical protein
MSSVQLALIIAAGIALAALPVIFVRKLGRSVLAEVLKTHPEHSISRIDPMANLFGVRSSGMRQVRGNGVLLATADGLYFRMLAPKREIAIPVKEITGFGTEKSFLGKSKGVPLLRVDYLSARGPESAAWAVRDLDGWLSTLSSIKGGRLQRGV